MGIRRHLYQFNSLAVTQIAAVRLLRQIVPMLMNPQVPDPFLVSVIIDRPGGRGNVNQAFLLVTLITKSDTS